MLSSTLTTVEIPPAGDKSKGKAHKRYGFGGKVNVATEAEIPYLTIRRLRKNTLRDRSFMGGLLVLPKGSGSGA